MALVDGIARRFLQQQTLEALKDARTLAADRVFEPHPWPTDPKLFPLLLVQVPIDRKTGVYPGQLEFNTTLTMVITGRVTGAGPEETNQQLDQLEEEILNAVMLDLRITRHVQQFVSINTSVVVSAEGKSYRGEIAISFDLAVFQVYGQIEAEPLKLVRGTLTRGVDGQFLAESGAPIHQRRE